MRTISALGAGISSDADATGSTPHLGATKRESYLNDVGYRLGNPAAHCHGRVA
jgi:hypothetical protein